MPKKIYIQINQYTEIDAQDILELRNLLSHQFAQPVQVNWYSPIEPGHLQPDGVDFVENTSPPKNAMLCLHFLLPKAEREFVVGCLEEDFTTEWIPKFGLRRANQIYWSHALRGIISFLWNKLLRVAFLIWLFKKIGF